jgi:hypothetical protein
MGGGCTNLVARVEVHSSSKSMVSSAVFLIVLNGGGRDWQAARRREVSKSGLVEMTGGRGDSSVGNG